MSAGEVMVESNVAACTDCMVVQGHLTHSHWEEPRLEPRLTHDLLSPVHDALEDSVEWGHPFDFAATRFNREEECASLKMPSPRSNGLRPRSAFRGFHTFITALEGPWAKNYGSGVSGPKELGENALEIE